jgi:hypothetical protein
MSSSATGVDQQLENDGEVGSNSPVGNIESEDVGPAEIAGLLGHQPPANSAIPVENGWSAESETPVEDVTNSSTTGTAPPIENGVRDEQPATTPDPGLESERPRAFNRDDPHFKDAARDVVDDIKVEMMLSRDHVTC